MQIITNTKLVENRAQWARRTTPVALVLLFSGLFVNLTNSNDPNSDTAKLALFLVLLGFIVSFISTHLVNRWIREPRADHVLEAALRGFGKEYTLFNYTKPASHILLTPQSLYVIVVKPQDGEISVNERKFRRKFEWRQLLRVFAEESVGNPFDEAEKEVNKLRQSLEKNQVEVPPIQPMIIFSHEKVKLILNKPAMPVLYAKELKNYLRKSTDLKTMSVAERSRLVEILGAV